MNARKSRQRRRDNPKPIGAERMMRFTITHVYGSTPGYEHFEHCRFCTQPIVHPNHTRATEDETRELFGG